MRGLWASSAACFILLLGGCTADTDGLSDLNAPPLSLRAGTLPVGTIGSPYTGTIEATGADGLRIAWSIARGPGWLAMDETAGPTLTVRGIPTTIGEVELLIRAVAENGRVAEGTFAFTVEGPPLVIVPDRLDVGEVGADYLVAVAADGGVGEYEWAVAQGNLPPGIQLAPDAADRTATLRGVPTTDGVYAFSLQVTDQAGQTAERAFEIAVLVRPFELIAVDVPSALRVGIDEVAVWRVEGGRAPYVVREVDRSNNLRVRANWNGEILTIVISPLQAGRATINIEMTDENMTSASTSATFDVTDAVQILTEQVPDGQQCLGYGVPLVATGGGSAGYEWTVVAGALPNGINVRNGLDGNFLQGVFVQPGRFEFTLRATTPNGASAERAYAIDVERGELNARHVAVTGTFDRPAQDVLVVDVCGPRPISETLVSPRTTGGTGRRSGVLGFSPDATRLAFVGDYEEPNRMDLFVTRVDTPVIETGTRWITATPTASVERFSWAPDSRTLVGLVPDAAGDYQLRLVGPSIDATVPGDPGRWSSDLSALAWAPTTATQLPRFAWLRDAGFVQGTGFVYELVLTLANGTTAQLSFGTQSVDRFSWKDADNIIYNQRDANRTWDLYETNTTRRSRDRLTSLESNQPLQIAVNPSGTGFAFFGVRSGWIRYVNGVPQRPQALLESTDADVTQFEWSSTGDRGVLRRGSDASLVTVNSDGTVGTEPLRVFGQHPVLDVGFSDDGRYALVIARASTAAYLYAADLQSSARTNLVRISQVPGLNLNGVSRFYSAPDGSRIAYTGELTLASDELFSVDMSGPLPGPPQRVTGPLTNSTEVSGTPAWRPDGRTIFYMSDEVTRGTRELWMVNFFGGMPSQPGRVSVVPRIASRIQRFAVPPR